MKGGLSIAFLLFVALTKAQFLALPVEAEQGQSMPHIVHEGARITLKAVVFDNSPCGSGYKVEWDVDRDGQFADEFQRTVTVK